jgi:hypothetical protein
MNIASPSRIALIVVGVLVSLRAASSARAQETPGPPRADGIEAIVVADTARGPIGTDVSERNMLDLLDRVRNMGIPVHVARVEGYAITPGSVLASVRRLDPGAMKSRTLLFYYAGHGGTDPKSGHFLRTPGGDLARSVLLAEIRAKSPRLSVVLTDCCSTRSTFKGPAPPAPMPSERRAIENLLLQHRGIVDVNSSSCLPDRGVYQSAFYHPAMGGLFTFAFTRMFAEVDPIFEREPDEELERLRPGSKAEFDYNRRFHSMRPWYQDRDEDGFLDWNEAVDHLGGVTMQLYQGYKDQVRKGMLAVQANPGDVRTLLSQVGQDPQVFGPLAVRSDKPAIVEPPRPEPARKPRLGVVPEDRYERGGAYVVIKSLEPRSPATRVRPWKGGRRAEEAVTLKVGDSITRVNNVRVRGRADLLRLLDDVPPGGEVNLSGKDAKTGRDYEVSATLDAYE